MSSPIPTQPIPPPLKDAICLLDEVLLRDDVPLDARLELSDVYSALLDVRPPYPPVLADSTTETDQPWTAVVKHVITALHPLITDPDPSASPSVMLRYGIAIRTLRATLTDTPCEPPGRPPTPADS